MKLFLMLGLQVLLLTVKVIRVVESVYFACDTKIIY